MRHGKVFGQLLNGGFNNLSIAASVGSKILTVALKGANGSDPSTTNPVTIEFRDETLTTGTPNVRTVTGALSIALASGGTLGFTAALAGRIYIWALDNAGTVMLGLSRTADIFPESNLVADPVDIGSGSDSATTMYVTTHVHNLACRCIGYIEITTGATAGEWDNAPTKIQVMGPGIKRTGDVVQVINYQVSASTTGATAIPMDDTIPQITEGVEFMSAVVVPTSVCNELHIDVVGWVTTNVYNKNLLSALFNGSSNALSACLSYTGENAQAVPHSIKYKQIAGTVSSITFS